MKLKIGVAGAGHLGKIHIRIIKELNEELEKFKKAIEESNQLYESMLDKTTQSLEKIISNTESLSKIQ